MSLGHSTWDPGQENLNDFSCFAYVLSLKLKQAPIHSFSLIFFMRKQNVTEKGLMRSRCFNMGWSKVLFVHCMCSCVWMYMCGHVCCSQSIYFDYALPSFLRQDLSLGSEPMDSARLAGQQVQGSSYLQLPSPGLHTCAFPHSTFCSAGFELRSSCWHGTCFQQSALPSPFKVTYCLGLCMCENWGVKEPPSAGLSVYARMDPFSDQEPRKVRLANKKAKAEEIPLTWDEVNRAHED